MSLERKVGRRSSSARRRDSLICAQASQSVVQALAWLEKSSPESGRATVSPFFLLIQRRAARRFVYATVERPLFLNVCLYTSIERSSGPGSAVQRMQG